MVHIIFLAIAAVMGILQFVRYCIIQRQKNAIGKKEDCILLERRESSPNRCGDPEHQRDFEENHHNCKDTPCKGKRTRDIADAEAEKMINEECGWKRVTLKAAYGSKLVLPYLSFLYALLCAFLGVGSVVQS